MKTYLKFWKRTGCVISLVRQGSKRCGVGVARVLAILGLGLILLLGALTYLLPPMLKDRLEQELSSATQREVRIVQVDFDPLAFRFVLSGLSLHDREGRDVAGMAGGEIDVSFRSIWALAPVLDRLDVQAPYLKVRRLPDGTYDVADWLEAWLSPSKDSAALPFAVRNLHLREGALLFEDQLLGKTHEIRALTVKIPHLSTFPADQSTWVMPEVSAQINGAPWRLSGQSQPFAARADSALEIAFEQQDLTQLAAYFPESFPLRIQSGLAGAKLQLQFNRELAGALSATLSGQLQVDHFHATDPGGASLIRWKAASVNVARADLLQRQLELESLRLDGPELFVDRDRRGVLNWSRVFPAEKQAGRAQEPTTGEAWALKQLEIQQGRVHWRDETATSPVLAEFTQISLALADLDSRRAPETESPLSLSMHLNPSGEIALKGSISWQPLAARVHLTSERIPLHPFMPYLGADFPLKLTRGSLSNAGALHLQYRDEDWHWGYQGAVSLHEGELISTKEQESLLEWRSLNATGLSIQMPGNHIRLSELALKDFYLKASLSQEGRLNWQALFPAEKATTDLAASSPRTQLPLSLGKILLEQGRLRLHDRYIQPNYTVDVTNVRGEVRDISSTSTAFLNLSGRYAQTAPVSINGRFKALADPPFVAVNAKIQGVDLIPLSTYAEKYAGYGIEKGSMSLALNYVLDQGFLTASNDLFIDQLTFGQAVESPNATTLPVRLAIALLKNNRGEIDLHLPIQGTLDDPEFSVRDLIFTMLGNLVVKVVSAPFSWLSGLWQDDAPPALLFESGQTQVTPEGQKILATLAETLKTRDGIILEITGYADAAHELLHLPPPERPAALTQLAMQRATVVAAWLVDEGKVPSPRVVILPTSERAAAGPQSRMRVDFSLR